MRREIVDFDKATAAELGLGEYSKSTYKSLVLAGVGAYRPKGRKPDISDVPGVGRDLYLAAKDETLGLPDDMIFAAGPFLRFAHDLGVQPDMITTETLRLYYEHRMAGGTKTQAKEKKHVKRVAAFFYEEAAGEPALAGFGVRPVAVPFADGRDKYRMTDALLAPVLKEFDEKVAPWARGEMSRDGLTRAELVTRLDAEEPQLLGKQGRLQRYLGKDPNSGARRATRRSSRPASCRATAPGMARRRETRRGYVVAFCKALQAGGDYLVELIEELALDRHRGGRDGALRSQHWQVRERLCRQRPEDAQEDRPRLLWVFSGGPREDRGPDRGVRRRSRRNLGAQQVETAGVHPDATRRVH